MRIMISPAQCRAARGFLAWSQLDLAQAANVGLSTVRSFETGTRRPVADNHRAIARALERAGIVFTDPVSVSYPVPQPHVVLSDNEKSSTIY
jgi:predicted transcriptional regulator